MILNAGKYRSLASAELVREKTRQRVAEFRRKKREQSESEAKGENGVTECNKMYGNVTPSETETYSTKGKHYVRDIEPGKASPLSANVEQIMKDKFWEAVEKVKPDASLSGDADEWRRLRAAADKCGYLYSVVKEKILRQHPRYGAWEFTEQFDSQKQIKFPENPKTGNGIGDAVQQKKKALAAKGQ